MVKKSIKFHSVMLLFSNRSQKVSKYGKSIIDNSAAPCVSLFFFFFFPHFDVICDLLMNRCKATLYFVK